MPNREVLDVLVSNEPFLVRKLFGRHHKAIGWWNYEFYDLENRFVSIRLFDGLFHVFTTGVLVFELKLWGLCTCYAETLETPEQYRWNLRCQSFTSKRCGFLWLVEQWKKGPLTSCLVYIGVSKNRGTPKSSISIGFSIINHPFWGTPIFGNTHIGVWIYDKPI